MSAADFVRMALRLLVLLALLLPAAAQRRCDASQLGYDCAKALADFYNLHWTLEGDVVHFALEGFGAQWVGFSFAEEEDEMAPADGVIGWLDVNGPNVRAYHIVTQSVFAQDEDPSINLMNVTALEDDERTIVAFSRVLTEGNVRVDPEAQTLINFAIGDTDSLRYHSDNRGSDTVRLAARSEVVRDGRFESPLFEAQPPELEMEIAFAPAPAPTSEFPPSEPPDAEPSDVPAEAPEMEPADAPAESELDDEEQIGMMLDELL